MPQNAEDHPPDEGTVGRVIWDARRAANLTQDELSEKLKTTRQVIIGWEQNNHTPKGPSRAKLLKHLPLTPEMLEPYVVSRGALGELRESVDSRMAALESQVALILERLDALAASGEN